MNTEMLPLVLGAGGTAVAGIVAVVKGYRWFVGQIREVITEAMRNHERVEGEWQKAIERRLDDIERKVDALHEWKRDR